MSGLRLRSRAPGARAEPQPQSAHGGVEIRWSCGKSLGQLLELDLSTGINHAKAGLDQTTASGDFARGNEPQWPLVQHTLEHTGTVLPKQGQIFRVQLHGKLGRIFSLTESFAHYGFDKIFFDRQIGDHAASSLEGQADDRGFTLINDL